MQYEDLAALAVGSYTVNKERSKKMPRKISEQKVGKFYF
jgi:hypothetical protein